MYDIFMKRPGDSSGVSIYQPANNNLRLISPKLTVELGKAGSLEFGVPSTNSYYDSNLEQLRTIVVVMQDGKELFRGRVLNRKKGFNNVVNVYCEGDLSYLVDSVQKAKKFDGKAIDLFKAIIAAHNTLMTTNGDSFSSGKAFEIGVIDAVDADRKVLLVGKSDKEQEKYEDAERTKFNLKQIAIDSIAEEWQNTYDYIDSCLIKYCGGYLRTRRGKKNGQNVTYIDWLKKGSSQFGTTTQTIEFAKNILDLNEEFNPEEAFSVLIPIGESTSDDNSKYDPLTVKNADSKTVTVNGHKIVHTKGSLEIVDETLVERFGRIVKTNVFDGVTEKDTLLTDGIRYIQDNADFPITIEVRAIDMHIVDSSVQTISLGNKVTILSQGHNINRSDLVCTKIEYDLANPANTVYTFGNPKQELTRRYKKDKKKQADQAGRSGGGGGGGGGGAAETNANTEQKEIRTKFFEEFITYDPNDKKAKISLGALYKEANQYGKNIQDVSKASVEFSATEENATIDMIAAFRNIQKAGIKISAGKNASSAEIFSMTENGAIAASIQTWVKSDASGIAMSADVVDIVCKKLNITAEKFVKITTKLMEIDGVVTIKNGHLSASIEAQSGSIYYCGGISGGFSEHKHKLTNVGSKVFLGGAYFGDDASFDMASTKWYKDKVEAAKKKGASSVSVSNVTRTGSNNIIIQLDNGKSIPWTL